MPIVAKTVCLNELKSLLLNKLTCYNNSHKKVQIIDRQTPDYDRIRSIEVRIGIEKVSGGPQRLDQLNQLCAQIPDEQTNTTVYDLPCTPGPIDDILKTPITTWIPWSNIN